MQELNFDTGLVEVSVNGDRTIKVNRTDVGFLENLYALLGKLDAIDSETSKKLDKSDNLAKHFDYYRASDKKMREAVDSLFGDGFCGDVFKNIRLMSVTPCGLTVIENFLYGVVDMMDDSVKESMENRSATISKYTAKYEKYHKK